MGNKFYLFFLVVVAIINLCTLDNYHNWGDDFSLYLHESKAILSNDLFNLHRINSDMMAHKKIGPNLYPTGYPLILAPLIYFKANFLLIKILNTFFLVGIIVLFKKISQRFFDKKHANITSLIFGTSSFIFFSTNEILSDLPAFFFALIVLLTVIKWRYEDWFSYQNYMLYFVFSIITLLTRTAYLTFFIGILFAFLLDNQLAKTKNWKNALTEICYAALPIIAVLTLNRLFLLSDGTNESKELSKIIFNPSVLIKILQNNFIYYFELFTLGLFSSKILVIALFIPVYYLRKLRFNNTTFLEKYEGNFRLNKHLFLSVIFLFTLSVFLIWPSQQGYRFILLNMALSFIFSVSALKSSPLIIKQCLALSYLYLFILPPLISRIEVNYNVFKTISLHRVVKKGEPGTKEFNAMIGYIKSNTQQDALIYFSKPRALHYFTSRKSYNINDQKSLKSGDWILIWNNEELKELKSQFANKLHFSCRSGGLQLYKII